MKSVSSPTGPRTFTFGDALLATIVGYPSVGSSSMPAGALRVSSRAERFERGMEIVDELAVELAGRPLRLGPPYVLVMDEELDGVHGSVDGLDPRR